MKLLTILLASIVLASCSNKYGSKYEAEQAATAYEDDGRYVLVTTYPSAESFELSREDYQNARKRLCDEAQQNLEAANDDISRGYAIMEQAQYCSSNDTYPEPKDLADENSVNVRSCFDEEATSKYVCKERVTDATEMSMKVWKELKSNITYFKY